ncbi:MAG TPA: hypothetical protein VF174_12960 [Micromonosporaceae bacterium]
MVRWIVLATVSVAVVTLAAAVRSVLVRLPRLRRSAIALQRHRARAEALQHSVSRLQERVTVLRGQAESARRRTARRGR